MTKNYLAENTRFITKNILSLRIRAKTKADILDYKPGQYVAISFSRDEQFSPYRCFSLTSSPQNRGRLELGIRIQGNFTRSLALVRPGDEIAVMGPFGDFTLSNTTPYREPVMIAGGIGVTPFISMIRSLAASRWPVRTTLIYSVRQPDDAAYYDELIRYTENPNFRLFLFVTDPNAQISDPAILRDRISPDKLDTIIGGAYSNKSFLLCGPTPFMTAMKDILRSRSVHDLQIITEEFSVLSPKGSGKSSGKPVAVYSTAAFLALLLFIVIADTRSYSRKIESANQSNVQGSQVIDQNQAATPVLPAVSGNQAPADNYNQYNSGYYSTPSHHYVSPRTRAS